MAEKCAPTSEKGSARKALLGLLAAAGLSLTGCGDNSNAKTAPNLSEATAKQPLQLAAADEARVFASLSTDVQTEIKAAFDECLAEVEEFATNVSGGDEDIYDITLADGEADCDSIRNSNIRSAKAKLSNVRACVSDLSLG